MGLISFEGKRSLFTYRDVKVRTSYILDSSKRVVRFDIYAVLDESIGERKLAAKLGEWETEEAATKVAHALVIELIDEHLAGL